MWTLIRHKNGEEVPIKVSVLDVFRSESRRDRKSTNNSHFTKPRANSKAPVTPKSSAPASGGGNTHNSSSSSSPSPLETWTPADDATLCALKTSNTPWKQILDALGANHTSLHQVKARWKEIEGRPAGSPALGGVGDGGGDERGEEKKRIAEKKKAEGLARQAELRGGNGSAVAGGGNGEGKKGKGKGKGILKNAGSVNVTAGAATSHPEWDVKSMAARYDRDKWLAVASRHFDRTGQRISPQMAREMCMAAA